MVLAHTCAIFGANDIEHRITHPVTRRYRVHSASTTRQYPVRSRPQARQVTRRRPAEPRAAVFEVPEHDVTARASFFRHFEHAHDAEFRIVMPRVKASPCSLIRKMKDQPSPKNDAESKDLLRLWRTPSSMPAPYFHLKGGLGVIVVDQDVASRGIAIEAADK